MRCTLLLLLSGVLLGSNHSLEAGEQPNRLTPEERAEGWTLLFDGATTAGWHSPKGKTFPTNCWAIEEGWLHGLGKGGGDIVTDGQFEEFELCWEWKLISGGNSGVKYFIIDSRGPIGHEYQMLDDDKHPDAKLGAGKRVTGAFYDVLKPQVKTPLKNPGEINQSRILVKGDRVEHWLNGVRILEYNLGSSEIQQAIAASKFAKVQPFGIRLGGHILLQDHNDKVWYRNIKVRKLPKS